jgi:hypothetical protein
MVELATAERWPSVPVDPDGHAYILTPQGRVEVRVPDDFPFASKAIPPGFQPKYHSPQ